MKKFLLYACVALLSCIAFAQTNVVVVLKEGVKKIYEAADVDSIRINKNEGYDAVVVLKNGKEEKYAAKDIDSIKIEKDAPVPAEETGLNFEYDGSAMIATVVGPKNRDLTEIVIPDSIIYGGELYAVTEIGRHAFEYCESLTSIVIPNSVTVIRDFAFEDCTSLESIEIPNSVIVIGRGAFSGCRSLTSIEIPNSVEYFGFSGEKIIEQDVFVGCINLDTVRVPSSYSVTKEFVFEDPFAVEPAHEVVFYDPLTGEIIPHEYETGLKFGIGEKPKDASIVGCYALAEVKIPSKVVIQHSKYEVYDVKVIKANAFKDYTELTSIEIPSSVTSIEEDAFIGCENLKAARLPSSLKGKVESAFPSTCEIEWYAVSAEETGLSFEYDETAKTASVKAPENKEVAEVTIPSKVLYDGKEYEVTSIGAEAFSACTELASVDIPESVTSIGESAFTSCIGLASIEIPNSVTEIGAGAFSFCTSLTSIEIPSSITSIGELTFFGCKNLKTARVPVGCELGNNAFPETCKINWYDPLTGEKIMTAEESFLTFEYDETTMTASVTGVENKELTFIKIGIPSKVLNDGKVYVVTSIGEYAFEKYESLESIEIPNSVTSIEASAFLGCKKLARIEIPSSVTSIGSTAFARCSSLKKARVPLSCEIEKIDVVSSFPSTCAIEWYDPLTSFTFWFDETAKTAIVTGFENYEATFVEIPSVVLQNGKEYDVTEIYASFGGCESLESIEIPNSVTTIGGRAFRGCRSLISIEIPESVTIIGDEAFGGCTNLPSIVIPNSVTGIGDRAFEGCESLESIEIPESIDAIGSSLFYECLNLKTARVPVKYKSSFKQFHYFDFPETCEIVWYASAEISGLKFEYDDATMTASVTGVENEEATFVEIPSVVLYEGKEYEVTSIGGSAFARCKNLASIDIPELVTSIGDRAFAGCVALTSIKIPSSVTSINESAFMHCVGLTGIEVDKDNKVYDSRENCNAIIETTSNTLIAGCQNTVIPESVTSIGKYAFDGCDNLTKIEIPNSITSIGECAFMACYNLTDIVIPESVTSIGEVAFYECINLKTARVPVSLKGKVESAFPTTCKINWYDPSTGEIVIFAEETDLKFSYYEESNTASVSGIKNYDDASEIKIPSQVVYNGVIYDVTSIKFNAFTYASYSSIEIPNSVTSIAEQSFLYCVNLTSIEIPSSVKKIGSSAFANCLNLKTARVPVGCELGNNAFPSTCEIVWYASADQTGLRFDYDQSTMTASVTHLYSYNEYNEIIGENYDFTEVKIPSQVLYDGNVYDVTEIRKFAFFDCTSLTSVEIPNSVTTIGTVAFDGCTSLTSIVVDKDNKVYDSRENCNAIIETASNTLVAGCQNTVIPNSVTSIGIYAFSDCTSLTSIEIPNSVTTIGKDAFIYCTSLTSIELGNSVTVIGDEAFYSCTSLTSIEIPESVTRIGYSAFADCKNLKTARVPKNCNYDSYSFPKECAIIKY